MSSYGLIPLRQHLCCNQAQLAAFFQIRRQTIAHIEKETRHLNLDNVQLVSEMLTMINDRVVTKWTSPNVQKQMNDDVQSARDLLLIQLAETRHNWQKTMLQLEKMKLTYDKTLTGIHNMNFIQQKTKPLKPIQMKWLSERIVALKTSLDAVNIRQQQLLEIRIQSLMAEINHINNLLGNSFDILVESYEILDKYSASQS